MCQLNAAELGNVSIPVQYSNSCWRPRARMSARRWRRADRRGTRGGSPALTFSHCARRLRRAIIEYQVHKLLFNLTCVLEAINTCGAVGAA